MDKNSREYKVIAKRLEDAREDKEQARMDYEKTLELVKIDGSVGSLMDAKVAYNTAKTRHETLLNLAETLGMIES
ncbi:hypothetical protein [Salinicoccus sp. CNSTN-B1]